MDCFRNYSRIFFWSSSEDSQQKSLTRFVQKFLQRFVQIIFHRLFNKYLLSFLKKTRNSKTLQFFFFFQGFLWEAFHGFPHYFFHRFNKKAIRKIIIRNAFFRNCYWKFLWQMWNTEVFLKNSSKRIFKKILCKFVYKFLRNSCGNSSTDSLFFL